MRISKKHVKLLAISAKEGDYIEPFTGGNKALGDMIMHFDNREELESIMGSMNQWLIININVNFLQN